MAGKRGAHWKTRTPGAVEQYLHQDMTKDEILIRHIATHKGMISLHLPKRCMDCGDTHPREGFAPAFNQGVEGQGEIITLVCNACYDRRCAREAHREALLERKAG